MKEMGRRRARRREGVVLGDGVAELVVVLAKKLKERSSTVVVTLTIGQWDALAANSRGQGKLIPRHLSAVIGPGMSLE